MWRDAPQSTTDNHIDDVRFPPTWGTTDPPPGSNTVDLNSVILITATANPGYAVGRLGCHLSGDGDWGTPTSLPWGVAYVNGTARWPYPPGVFVHPAPLYELVALLGIFALLLRLRTRMAPAGALFATYLLLSGLARLLVEFVWANRPRSCSA